jgi:hypothetical protein
MKNNLQILVGKIFQKIIIQKTIIFWAVFALLLLFRLWLGTGIPLVMIYGPHDDFFMVKAAHHIIHGDWMGPYSQMTLIKGPFYSFFLIFSYLTGLPLFLNETIFYIVACIVVFFAFRPLIKNHRWRLLLFVLLLFCPVSMATGVNIRVYREFIYFSLTLYVLAFSIGLFLRVGEKISTLFLWAVGLGLSMGMFMITREEGIWIYPMLSLLLFYCLFIIWKGGLDKKLSRSFLVLLPVVLWCLPIFGVSYLNYSHYGYWGTTEMLDPDMNRVLSTLGRIQSSSSYPHVQVTQEALKKAYEVSPLLLKLRPVIKSLTPAYTGHSYAGLQVYPAWYLQEYSDDGKEVGKGHFLWLMRDAVYSSGYYQEGKYPHEFYGQLADQLEAACNDGKLDCNSKQTFPISRQFATVYLRLFNDSVFQLLRLDRVKIIPADLKKWQPEGGEYIMFFEQLIYNPVNLTQFSGDHISENRPTGAGDLQLEAIRRKAKIMDVTMEIYKGFTLPAFAVSFIAWLILMILFLLRKQKEYQLPFVVITIFLIGLMISRLTTLVILVGGSGTSYASSIYLFIYMFIFLLLYWCLSYASVSFSGRGFLEDPILEETSARV